MSEREACPASSTDGAPSPGEEKGTKRPAPDSTSEGADVHSANDWEHANLGDDSRKNKFLRLMGASKKEHQGRFVIGDNQRQAHRPEGERDMTGVLENQFQHSMEYQLQGGRRAHLGLGYQKEPEAGPGPTQPGDAGGATEAKAEETEGATAEAKAGEADGATEAKVGEAEGATGVENEHAASATEATAGVALESAVASEKAQSGQPDSSGDVEKPASDWGKPDGNGESSEAVPRGERNQDDDKSAANGESVSAADSSSVSSSDKLKKISFVKASS